MMRWLLLMMAVLLLNCSGPTRPLAETIPATVDGWTRSDVKLLQDNEVPEMVRRLGVEEAVSTTYTGPAAIPVKVFKMKGQTSAFELIQKWRQSDGLAVYSSSFFVVADPAGGPDTGRLLQALQKSLK